MDKIGERSWAFGIVCLNNLSSLWMFCIRRDSGLSDGTEILQAARSSHNRHHQHRRLFHLSREPLRSPHQRRAGDRSGLHQGLHVAVHIARHVRSGHERGQDILAAEEKRGLLPQLQIGLIQ